MSEHPIAGIESIVKRAMVREQIPGMGIAVTRGEALVLAAGFGLANVELGVSVSAESVFELASITKLFTAEAIMLLAHQKRLNLNHPIGTYLPDLPDLWQPIPIHFLLAHQSGIHSYTSTDSYWKTTRLDISRDEILALVANLPLDFSPGQRYSYDNSGYYLLGLLIEAVSGQPYATFLAEQIFAPLGMLATRANDPYALIPNRVQGYSVHPDGGLLNAEYYATSGTFSAGAMVSTPADMGRWMASLHTERVLPVAVRREMWRPRPSHAANEREHHFSMELGWFQVDSKGEQFVGHNCSIVGFAISLIHFIESQLSICVLCNLDAVTEPHAIAQEIKSVMESCCN